MIKSYKSRVVISGSIVELYEYEKEVLEGFTAKGRNKGRSTHASEEDKLVNREKVVNRARKDIRRLVNTNIKSMSKFITLTFAENIQEFDEANYEFKKFIQRLSYKLGRKIEYLCVPEFQKRGAIHYHVIMFNVPYVANKELSDIWGNGFVRINKIDSVTNVGAYICKYMDKDFDVNEKLKGHKCYFTSRGLEKPIEIKEEKQVKELTDSLPADKKVYENTFSNEINTTHYKQYNLKK